ncbi:MAG: hypothetical protein VX701_03475 [Chloroflexota bacterium]|nr:hypothetical protein [Chloroflexota bacterium]
MQKTWGLQIINGVLDDCENIVLKAIDMHLDGFERDDSSEYRVPSVFMNSNSNKGTISCQAPNCGRRYLGFVTYDNTVDVSVEIWVDDVKIGVAKPDANNHRECLFTTTESFEFTGQETITLRASQQTPYSLQDKWISHGPPMEISPYETRPLTGLGSMDVWPSGCRIESIGFFQTLPSANSLSYEFNNIHTQPILMNDEFVVTQLTWVTTWDATCRVEYWVRGSNEIRSVMESIPLANHRVNLPDLSVGTIYGLTISAMDGSGNNIARGPIFFKAESMPSVRGSAFDEHVDLSIKNISHEDVLSAPLRCGIPFPKGYLGSSDNMRLKDQEGKEISLQSKTTSNWQDGSVKWAMLDFQKHIGANSDNELILEYGSNINKENFPSSLTIQDTPERITVDSGRLEVKVDRSGSRPISEILIDGDSYVTSMNVVINGTDGDSYVSEIFDAEDVIVEESGPVHSVIRVLTNHSSRNGKYLFKSVFRIHVYAGMPYIRVDHTFINDVTNSTFTDIRSMYLNIEAKYSDLKTTELVQTHDNKCLMDGKTYNKRLSGKVKAASLEMAVVDFWQQYPKSIRIDSKGIQFGICPDIQVDDYSDTRDNEYKLYYYLKDGVYKFREGLSKTHTFYLGLDLPELPLPIAQADTEWYCSSGAFGDVLPSKDERIFVYESKFNDVCTQYLEGHERHHEYGMLNFGDTCKPSINWLNMEYDTPFVFFVQWARTGDVRWLQEACRAVTHHRDVDTCHASKLPMDTGGVYRHCAGHTGGYYPVDTKGLAASGQFTASHTWVDGFLLHYYLTGEPRSIETARLVADRLDVNYTRNYDFSNCRIPGWHLIHDLGMYNATAERFYLNAAEIITKRVIERQDIDGGWRRTLVLGHCKCAPPKHLGNAGFMVGILLNGLSLLHKATGDRAVSQAIVRGAKFLVDELWDENTESFRYTSCPESEESSDDIGQMLSGIAYAWKISRTDSFEPILKLAVPKSINALVSEGRYLSSNLRALPNVLHDAMDLLDKNT